MATPAQIDANRLNAQKSTGPRSVEGKAAACYNALKHGLDAQTDVLPGEDPETLASIGREYHDSFKPDGAGETELVENLIQAAWLKRRYTRTQNALLTNLIKARGGDPTEALGAIYAEAAPNSNIFKVARLLEAANRVWFRAQKLLQSLQAARFQAEWERAQAEKSKRFLASKFPNREAETENWLRSDEMLEDDPESMFLTQSPLNP